MRAVQRLQMARRDKARFTVSSAATGVCGWHRESVPRSKAPLASDGRLPWPYKAELFALTAGLGKRKVVAAKLVGKRLCARSGARARNGLVSKLGVATQPAVPPLRTRSTDGYFWMLFCTASTIWSTEKLAGRWLGG
jgi:hypothetical protein